MCKGVIYRVSVYMTPFFRSFPVFLQESSTRVFQMRVLERTEDGAKRRRR
jgi:hypothetical protein